jgi:hypothetical protein
MFKKFNSNDFAFEIKVPQMDQIKSQLDINGRRMSLSVLIAGFFIASGLAVHQSSGETIAGYPILAVIFFAVGCVFLMILLIKSLR